MGESDSTTPLEAAIFKSGYSILCRSAAAPHIGQVLQKHDSGEVKSFGGSPIPTNAEIYNANVQPRAVEIKRWKTPRIIAVQSLAARGRQAALSLPPVPC